MRVSCYSCLAEYEVTPEQGLAGSSFECGECGEQVEVPADLEASDESAAETPAPVAEEADGPEVITLAAPIAMRPMIYPAMMAWMG